MITFQELLPGSLVSETMLMERTGFGGTPIREALKRLTNERMVEINPSRGVAIASMPVEAQLKLPGPRRPIEELAAYRVRSRQRDDILELVELLDQFDSDSAEEFGRLLERAHDITAAAHSEYLSDWRSRPCKASPGGFGSLI